MRVLITVLLALAPAFIATSTSQAAQTTPTTATSQAVVSCADRAGHLEACGTCPSAIRLGGARRAGTLLAQLEADSPTLVISAGNDLFGGASGSEAGATVRDLYDTIGLDVMNLGYRDFRFGLDETVELLKPAGFQVVSANLFNESDERLYPPFATWSEGETSVAVIGVTMEPGGIAYLPHLQRQLAGLRFRDPIKAVREALPEA